VVIAWQSLAFRARQSFVHDTAQRHLDHLGVIEEILGDLGRLVHWHASRGE
jgi:hypothetical protein